VSPVDLEALPGMGELLPALEGLPPAYLVGGAVRDLLRGADHVDLDVAVEGDALSVARTVAERLGGVAVEHDRFGTATVTAPELTFDVATTRRERYPAPGVLPEVEPAPLAEDLARRDFTVNAMALGLSGGDRGRLHDPHGGREDLERRLVRVLHDRSFIDDPTRLLRALRYEARLGGRLDPHTERLAREAIATGAPATVSGARIRDELLELLREPAAVARLPALGLDRALELRVDPELVASAQLASGDTGADPLLAALAAMAPGSLDKLQLSRDAQSRVAHAATSAPRLVDELRGASPSQTYDLLHGLPPEALALALALGAPGEPILRYVAELAHVRLEITGDDLIAAGVPQSPAIGAALRETLRRKLDGEVSGHAEELRLALSLVS
jgi:tRNA nucleotidyltransferase (CCA-adding enzyme)